MNSTPPRLAVLVRRYPKLSETFILAELLGLERAGFEITIFSLHRPSDAICQPAGARVRAAVVYLDCKPEGASADIDCARALAAQLRARGIRHLHAHFIDRPGAIAALAARLADASFSLSAHAKDIYLSDPDVLARRLPQAAFVATCTEYNRQALLRIAPDAHVNRIYHGIDTHQFNGRRSCCEVRPIMRILAVGRLREKKGFATLIEACALLRDSGAPQFRCDIVGYGEQGDALHARIEALGLREGVHLRGKMSHASLIELYRESDVFAAPCEIAPDGDRDGIPNVLLEAMAMQLPVISTAVSGIGELIKDGENGILVAPADPVALGRALGRVLDSAALRSQLGRRARATVIGQFAVQDNLPTLIRLLEPYTTASPRRESVTVRSGAPVAASSYAGI